MTFSLYKSLEELIVFYEAKAMCQEKKLLVTIPVTTKITLVFLHLWRVLEPTTLRH